MLSDSGADEAIGKSLEKVVAVFVTPPLSLLVTPVTMSPQKIHTQNDEDDGVLTVYLCREEHSSATIST